MEFIKSQPDRAYNLIGAVKDFNIPSDLAKTMLGGVKLADYVGQQVEISGTIRSEQQIAATSGTISEQPAKGTTATPKVSTETELDVKTMDVARVSPTGHRCD